MEVPSSVAGVVKEVKVKVGDEISEGAVVAVIEGGGAVPSPARSAGEGAARRKGAMGHRVARAPPSALPASFPRKRRKRERRAESGRAHRAARPISNARLRARLRARRLHGGIPRGRSRPEHGADRTLRDARRRLSQRRLHSVEGAAARGASDRRGRACERHRHRVRRAEDRHRQARARSRTRSSRSSPAASPAWASSARSRSCTGVGKFVSPNEIEVETKDGKKLVRFEKCIIAAGSQSVKLPGFPWDDPRMMDSTDALLLAGRAEETAGRRRRHHRSGNGLRVRRARQRRSPWSSCSIS